MLTTEELAALQSVISQAEEDLANWRPIDDDEQESWDARAADCQLARAAIERESGTC